MSLAWGPNAIHPNTRKLTRNPLLRNQIQRENMERLVKEIRVLVKSHLWVMILSPLVGPADLNFSVRVVALRHNRRHRLSRSPAAMTGRLSIEFGWIYKSWRLEEEGLKGPKFRDSDDPAGICAQSSEVFTSGTSSLTFLFFSFLLKLRARFSMHRRLGFVRWFRGILIWVSHSAPSFLHNEPKYLWVYCPIYPRNSNSQRPSNSGYITIFANFGEGIAWDLILLL